ncbi:MAG: DUF4132 domain-containing protein [Bifidobacteriaceae bacterium]|nr:DUF4132 domain-containing protein [Bifidobacteriaceae bacterium]
MTELENDPDALTPGQWVAVFQLLTTVRPAQELVATAPGWVPSWLLAINALTTGYELGRTWEPAFADKLLTAVEMPPDRKPIVIAYALMRGVTATSWRVTPSAWTDPDGAGPSLSRYLADNAAAASTALTQLDPENRTTATRLLRHHPETCRRLAVLFIAWAVDGPKALRQAAALVISDFPPELRRQAIASALKADRATSHEQIIDLAVTLGDDGRDVLRQALGDAPPKLAAQLTDALERGAALSQIGSPELAIPPAPPLGATGLEEPDVLAKRLRAGVDALAERRRAKVAAGASEWYVKSVKHELRRWSQIDFGEVAAWLAGRPGVARPDDVEIIPVEITAKLSDLPLVVRVKASTVGWSGETGLYDSRFRDVVGTGPDLRNVAQAAELAGVARPVTQVADLVLGWAGLRGWDLDAVWPFFAEHPEVLEPILESSQTGHPSGKLKPAFQVLAAFPVLPEGLVARLAQLATGAGKTYRREAQDLLAKQPGCLAVAERGLGSGNGQIRATSAQWIGRLGRPEAVGPLAQALARERSETVQAALLAALKALGQDISGYLSPAALAQAANKGLAKKLPAGMEWFPLAALPECRWANGDPVDPSIIRWWAVLAVKLKDPAGAGLIPLYLELLDQASAERLGQFALDAWIAQDTQHPSDAECRLAAAAEVDFYYDYYQRMAKDWPDIPDYALTGQLTKDEVFERLRREKGQTYIGSAIGQKGLLALAAGAPGHYFLAAAQRYAKDHYGRRAQIEALVIAASANPDPATIQFVLAAARSFKQVTVRAKAAELADLIAARHGWTRDELADRTVQTAGFEDSGELVLDFGPRAFTGRIARSSKTGAFTIQLFNPDGKPIKALPKPSQADNPDLAKEARALFTTAKKELTQVAKLQTSRLFEAMCVERDWAAPVWQDFLAGHPIMRPLIATLVWKAQTPDGGHSLFRPTEDGELLDAHDDEHTLPADAQIRLAHLATVSAEEAEQWRAHLADYKVNPLFRQFDAATPTFGPEAVDIKDHLGWLSDSLKLRSRAASRGYSVGQAEDGGWVSSFTKELPASGLQIAINCTGMPVEAELIAVAVTTLKFWDQAGRALPLSQVPPILLAESYADYVHLAEAGVFDPEWEKKSEY